MHINSYNCYLTSEEMKLPLATVSAGVMQHQYQVHRPTGIPDYQFLYTGSGEGVVSIREKEYRLTPGTCFITPPFFPHDYRAVTPVWQTNYLTFRGRVVDACFPFPVDIRNVPSEVFMPVFTQIYQARLQSVSEWHKTDWAEWRKNTAGVLFNLLIEIANLPGVVPVEAPPPGGIPAALAYISEHYCENCELATLAEIASLSEGHFCRAFRAYTHKRPMEYILHLRLEKAKALLVEQPNTPIARIALAVGFSGVSYFTHCFREYTQRTPSEYRECYDSGEKRAVNEAARRARAGLPQK